MVTVVKDGALSTVSFRSTGIAALYVPFPAWLAVMVVVPAPTMITLLPEIVATFVLLLD